LIDTPKGARPVEELQLGDLVFTRDNGAQEIRWIGAKPVSRADIAADVSLAPILIRKGSLGANMPERDLLVSPSHRMLVKDATAEFYFAEPEVLVAAKHLIGRPGISRVAVPQTSYIHFMCDRHEVVRSNGAWSESFQPGDYSLNGIDHLQRMELLKLFPELQSRQGVADFCAARRSLKRHEAELLIA